MFFHETIGGLTVFYWDFTVFLCFSNEREMSVSECLYGCSDIPCTCACNDKVCVCKLTSRLQRAQQRDPQWPSGCDAWLPSMSLQVQVSA